MILQEKHTVSSDRPIEKAVVGVNGNGALGHELLGRRIVTSEKDDSFALLHSVIEHNDLECDGLPWFWKAKFLFNFVGFMLRLAVISYRKWAPKSTPNVRRLVGPRGMNWLLGLLIHPLVDIVREGVTTSAALDALYATDHYFPHYFKNIWRKPWRVLWIPGALITWMVCNLPGPRAVRNRLKILYPELLRELHRQADKGKRCIRVTELACGSAEAEIFALWRFRQERPEVNIHLTLVDVSQSSLRRAMRLAEKLGVKQFIEVPAEGNLKKYLKVVPSASEDVIGIVGFFDYRPAESIVGLAVEIRRVLVPDGAFFGAHIAPADWAYTTENLIGWPGLIRRTKDEYAALLREGGWKDDELRFIVEPLGEHIVSVGKKEE